MNKTYKGMKLFNAVFENKEYYEDFVSRYMEQALFFDLYGKLDNKILLGNEVELPSMKTLEIMCAGIMKQGISNPFKVVSEYSPVGVVTMNITHGSSTDVKELKMISSLGTYTTECGLMEKLFGKRFDRSRIDDIAYGTFTLIKNKWYFLPFYCDYGTLTDYIESLIIE